MDKFDSISGSVGDNDYQEFKRYSINVDSFSTKDINNLEKNDYQKHFGYCKDGNWINALANEKGEIDPKEKLKMEKDGYILKKEKYKEILIPLDQCKWINNVIGNGMKEIVICFQYDRHSDLDYQEKKLKKNTFLTYKDVLEFVEKFYNKTLTKKELNLIRKTDDCFGYAEKAQDAYMNNKKIKRKEVMGDCVFFEGFREESIGKYTLYLGS
jgi:hypothetical protein